MMRGRRRSPGSAALRTRRARDPDAVLDALGHAVIVTGVDGRIVQWNRAAAQLYGVEHDEALGQDVVEVVVPEAGRAAARAILDGVAAGEPWRGRLTAEGPDGPVQIVVEDHPVFDESGTVVAVVGISEDVTANELLRRGALDLADRLRLALDAGGLGTWHWDLGTGVTTWDPQLEELFGLAPGAFDGQFETWTSLIHPDDVPRTLATLDEAVATKRPYVFEHRIIRPDGTVRWLQGKGQVTLDDAGKVTGTIGCAADITAQMLAAHEREQLVEVSRRAAEHERVSRERLEFLGRLNDALAAATSQARGDARRHACGRSPPRRLVFDLRAARWERTAARDRGGPRRSLHGGLHPGADGALPLRPRRAHGSPERHPNPGHGVPSGDRRRADRSGRARRGDSRRCAGAAAPELDRRAAGEAGQDARRDAVRHVDGGPRYSLDDVALARAAAGTGSRRRSRTSGSRRSSG